MRHKVFICICTVALAVALLLAGCSNKGEPSNHSKYASALSHPLEETCKIIGIQQEDMTEVVKGLYSTPLKAELAGQTLDILLGLNLTTEEKELLQVVYRKVYPDLSETTVQGVNALVTAVSEQYGEPSQQRNYQEEGEQIPMGYTQWDLTETVSEDLATYMKQLEEEYGGPAYYRLDLEVSEEEGTCYVSLKYMVGVIPSKR